MIHLRTRRLNQRTPRKIVLETLYFTRHLRRDCLEKRKIMPYIHKSGGGSICTQEQIHHQTWNDKSTPYVSLKCCSRVDVRWRFYYNAQDDMCRQRRDRGLLPVKRGLVYVCMGRVHMYTGRTLPANVELQSDSLMAVCGRCISTGLNLAPC